MSQPGHIKAAQSGRAGRLNGTSGLGVRSEAICADMKESTLIVIADSVIEIIT